MSTSSEPSAGMEPGIACSVLYINSMMVCAAGGDHRSFLRGREQQWVGEAQRCRFNATAAGVHASRHPDISYVDSVRSASSKLPGWRRSCDLCASVTCPAAKHCIHGKLPHAHLLSRQSSALCLEPFLLQTSPDTGTSCPAAQSDHLHTLTQPVHAADESARARPGARMRRGHSSSAVHGPACCLNHL